MTISATLVQNVRRTKILDDCLRWLVQNAPNAFSVRIENSGSNPNDPVATVDASPQKFQASEMYSPIDGDEVWFVVRGMQTVSLVSTDEPS